MCCVQADLAKLAKQVTYLVCDKLAEQPFVLIWLNKSNFARLQHTKGV
jgi:hypothetical protein